MKEPITTERWQSAQAGEFEHHIKESVEHSFEVYKQSYKQYFYWLHIQQNDLEGKSIIEIGPGRISSLLFCKNYGKSYIIEPTHYDGISHLYEGKNLEIIKNLAENIDFPPADEVWLFNVMQHVKNPDLIIQKCKQSANVVRFFEPIDLPINNEHPFTFSIKDFKNYFGDCVKEYVAEENVKNFHTANCAYGKWLKTNATK